MLKITQKKAMEIAAIIIEADMALQESKTNELLSSYPEQEGEAIRNYLNDIVQSLKQCNNSFIFGYESTNQIETP